MPDNDCMCAECNGSGEGYADGTICLVCKGKGEVPCTEVEEEDDDR